MEREVNRGADADGRPPPQPSSSPAFPEGEGSSNSNKVKSLRDRVSFSSSSRPRPSCWGRIRIHRIGRSSSRRRGGAGGDEHGAAPAATAAPSRLCPGDRGRCGCRGAAVAAVGARSLLQRNDFYCDDCNTHITGR